MLQEPLACWFIFHFSPLGQGEHEIQSQRQRFPACLCCQKSTAEVKGR